jgi:hypothetical protein
MSHVTKSTNSQDLHIIPLWIDGSAICGVKGSGWGQSNSIWGINESSVEKTLVSAKWKDIFDTNHILVL